VSGYSSTSRSSTVLVASSCCFLKPSVTGATMKGSRMALKISLSLSMATNGNWPCDKRGQKLLQEIKESVRKTIKTRNHMAMK
jgi:hypothetical protein